MNSQKPTHPMHVVMQWLQAELHHQSQAKLPIATRVAGVALFVIIACVVLGTLRTGHWRKLQLTDSRLDALDEGHQWRINDESRWGHLVVTSVERSGWDWPELTFVIEDYTRGRVAVYAGEPYLSDGGSWSLRLKLQTAQPEDKFGSFAKQNQHVPEWPEYLFIRPSFDTASSDGVSQERIVVALGADVFLSETRREIDIDDHQDLSFAREDRHWTIRTIRTASEGTREIPDKPEITLRKTTSETSALDVSINQQLFDSCQVLREGPRRWCYPVVSQYGMGHVTFDGRQVWMVPDETTSEFIRATK